MWRETTKHERNLKIWREELDEFMPDKVLDFHVHLMNHGVVSSPEMFSSAGHPLAKYDLDDLDQDLAEMYPGRQTSAVCFGMPNCDYDFAANNAYIAEACDGERFFPLRLFDPNERDHACVRSQLINSGFLGIKPYLNFVEKDDPNQVEIYEMLPPWIMEIVDELGLIVMLHIPRKARLADEINQRQIVELCRRYPNAKIVLAHVGRAYFLNNVLGNLDRLKQLPNLWYDLAMLNHWEVLEHLFLTVSPDKILYATDIPIALAPGKSVEINNQYTYVTPVPWKLSISDEHRKLVFTSFLYEELRAIKKAVQRSQLSAEFTEALFYGNGMKLLRSGDGSVC